MCGFDLQRGAGRQHVRMNEVVTIDDMIICGCCCGLFDVVCTWLVFGKGIYLLSLLFVFATPHAPRPTFHAATMSCQHRLDQYDYDA